MTCIEPVEAYYSGYGGNPIVWLNPGDAATVVAIAVPCVNYSYRRKGGTATFVYVDFLKNSRSYSAALYYNNIRILEKDDVQTDSDKE